MNHEDDVRRLLTDSRWDEDADTDFLPLLSAAIPARRFRRRIGRTLGGSAAVVLLLGMGAAIAAAHHTRPATLATTSQNTSKTAVGPGLRECSLTPAETQAAPSSNAGFTLALYDDGPGACALPRHVEVTVGHSSGLPGAALSVTVTGQRIDSGADVVVASHHEVAASVTAYCTSRSSDSVWTLTISDPGSGKRIASMPVQTGCAPGLSALTVHEGLSAVPNPPVAVAQPSPRSVR